MQIKMTGLKQNAIVVYTDKDLKTLYNKAKSYALYNLTDTELEFSVVKRPNKDGYSLKALVDGRFVGWITSTEHETNLKAEIEKTPITFSETLKLRKKFPGSDDSMFTSSFN